MTRGVGRGAMGSACGSSRSERCCSSSLLRDSRRDPARGRATRTNGRSHALRQPVYAAGRSASSSRLSASSDRARRSIRRTASWEIPESATGFGQRGRIVAVDPVAELDDLAFALGQPLERPAQRVATKRDLDLLLGTALVAREQRAE